MKLSRTEANWIASRLLSDAEQERERVVGRRTAWLTILFPALAFVRLSASLPCVTPGSELQDSG